MESLTNVINPTKMELDSRLVGFFMGDNYMYITRHIETVLNKAEKQTKVILLTGARQVGKTTAIREVFPEYEYITLDDENELKLAREDRSLFFRDRNFPFIIDEVQYAKDLFPVIKKVVDENEKKGQIFLTGSQTYDLLASASESLAGRISVLELSNLSMREINGLDYRMPFIPTEDYFQQRKQANIVYDNIWNQIHRGFYPDLINEERDWAWFYRDYVRTYIERDVRQIVNIRDEVKFRNFISVVAALSGQVLKYETIANTVGIDIKTAQNWVSVLQSSGIVKLLHCYQNNALKRAIKSPKIYMMDTGLLCYLVGWNTPESARNGAMAGEIFETYIVSEIIKSYLNAGEDINNIYYYRDKDKREIDIVIANNNRLYPIEIKKGATIQKGWTKNFSALKASEDVVVEKGCVICLIDKIHNISEDAFAIPMEYI